MYVSPGRLFLITHRSGDGTFLVPLPPHRLPFVSFPLLSCAMLCYALPCFDFLSDPIPSSLPPSSNLSKSSFSERARSLQRGRVDQQSAPVYQVRKVKSRPAIFAAAVNRIVLANGRGGFKGHKHKKKKKKNARRTCPLYRVFEECSNNVTVSHIYARAVGREGVLFRWRTAEYSQVSPPLVCFMTWVGM
ncbi:uncharacterized protein LY79DRAFT_270368 [Colletotrichum navitas]|uniref:Uncharacterized protein n=1 Tax=Colletotrichum navitas TaxID=681940 RepID=A0AAD8PV79_9PEZI|nr:uncharacterized protein LY79DRAFT_270368 [Colletotrichum navitas]KAK1585319.1 hypothetical protein LY79DRAFT_270368 [Colletotrichum navitas]